MSVEPASLEAALVHAMRLVGVGTDCNGICNQRPRLEVEHCNGEVVLAISTRGAQPADTPRDRSVMRLMAQAAERAASDHGGSMTLDPDTVTFRLPLREDDRTGSPTSRGWGRRYSVPCCWAPRPRCPGRSPR